ncbi:MAG: ParM/StbA family protein [Ramlibacter sp.]
MKTEMSSVRVAARALDVGYCNVKYTLGRKVAMDKSSIATGMFPALSPRVTKQHGLGGMSSADGCLVEVNGITHFVGAGAVYCSSGSEPRHVLANYSSTDKYLAQMRGGMYYMLLDQGAPDELVIEQLVVGLPLNTFRSFRQPLIDRTAAEHLVTNPSTGGTHRIIVERAHVMVQPQGALLNYHVNDAQRARDGWCLVIDPGGGTLDWYVSQGKVPNWERSGAYGKAMLACAYAVADKIQENWRDQFEIIDRIDTAIRQNLPSFRVGGYEYELEGFRAAIEGVLEDSIDHLVTGVRGFDNFDHILFTGGGARVYYDFLSKRMPKLRPVMRLDEDPIFANVRGFQIGAELLLAGNTTKA